MSAASRRLTPVVLALLLGFLAFPTAAGNRLRTPRGNGQLPLLVTLIHHHSTEGIASHALPVLREFGATATLALMILELPRTQVPPTEVSSPDLPGGLGNVQPLSLGQPDADGLYGGRLYLGSPGDFMSEAQLQALAAAGWELAFHGADHTPQSTIVQQVDGPGKLARAYAATTAEIRRLLGDASYPVVTNTLASNGWSPAVRQVAADRFTATEVAWRSSYNHVPVAFMPGLDPHGDFNSIDFQRAWWDGQPDIDEIVRLAGTGGGGWLIVQLHDVVTRLEDSPDPDRAMLVDEYRSLVSALAGAGARFVTFAEGAALVATDSQGNHLRNTRFGNHPFRERPANTRLDWTSSAGAGGQVVFGADGVLELVSMDGPASPSATQWLSPGLMDSARYLLRLKPDLTAVQSGQVRVLVRGPLGERVTEVSPLDSSFCIDLSLQELVGPDFAEGDLVLTLQALGLVGRARLGDLSFEPVHPAGRGCGNGPRR